MEDYSFCKRDRRADCSWASKPGSESINVFLFGLHPKIKPETFLVGSEAYKLEVKASHMLLRGLHPTKPRDHLLSSE